MIIYEGIRCWYAGIVMAITVMAVIFMNINIY